MDGRIKKASDFESEKKIRSTSITVPVDFAPKTLNVSKDEPGSSAVVISLLNGMSNQPISGFSMLAASTVDLGGLPEEHFDDLKLEAQFDGSPSSMPVLFDWSMEWRPYSIPLIEELPEVHVDEDTTVNHAIDLALYASDVTDEPNDLVYEISDVSGEEVVGVTLVDDHFVEVDAALTPDWNSEENGAITARVTATNSEGRSSRPVQLTIFIEAVNDEPVAYQEIPDITLMEGDEDSSILLASQPYFTDIELDRLYYKVEVDPWDIWKGEEDNITAVVDQFSQELTITSIGDFNTDGLEPVPIWIYADDDTQVNTLEDGNLDPSETIPNWVHQEILLTVLNMNDPPVWEKIPDLVTDEDVPIENAFLLKDYVSDVDNPSKDFTYKLRSNSDKRLKVTMIPATSGISLEPAENAYGSSVVEVEVSDGEDKSKTTFKVIVNPVNDAPWLQVLSQREGDILMDNVTFYGVAGDVEGELKKIEVMMGDGDSWAPVTGTDNWEYVLNTNPIPNGPITIRFRCFDGELHSGELILNLTVDNPVNKPPVVAIGSPSEGASVADGLMTVSGSSSDADGEIKKVSILIGNNQDWVVVSKTEGSWDRWSFQFDNTPWAGGSLMIRARAFDGTAHSAHYNVTFTVQQVPVEEDKDTTKENNGGDGWSLLIFAFVGVLIAVILVVLLFMWRRKRKEMKDPEEHSGNSSGYTAPGSLGPILSGPIEYAPPAAGVPRPTTATSPPPPPILSVDASQLKSWNSPPTYALTGASGVQTSGSEQSEDVVKKISELSELQKKGVITFAEFEESKRKLLGKI